ncbi:MAG: DUF624 domain-containing protein [Eubacteriales bacterium]|nr:DUF624 domain-containing protein [Eubacteriales bacterium]
MKKGKDFQGKKLFGYDGDFYTYTGKLFDLCLVSVYWLLGCLPVVTAGASFCALYGAVTRSLRQDRDSVTRQFWRIYRQNLLPSLPLTLFYGGGGFLLLLNMGILHARTDSLWGAFFIALYGVLLAVFGAAACYAFPALSRFQMPFAWFLKLSFYMAVRHLPVSILLLAILGGAYLALLNQMALFWILPGAAAWAASALLEPLLDRHMPKEEEKE